jgi:hypothetical protein
MFETYLYSCHAYSLQVDAACGNYSRISPACGLLLGKIGSFEVDTNGYDAYRTCYQPKSAGAARSHPVTLGDLIDRIVTKGEDSRAAVAAWARARAGERVPCINSVQGTSYLNTAAAKQALHVQDSPNTWQICGGVDYRNDGVYDSMIAVHRENMKHNPRVLIYNGDVDPGCNYLWAEASVFKFGRATSKDWHPWVYDTAHVGEQLGGFVTDYEGDVHFATVHGAGHMSPQWRPEAVFNMFQRFLNGQKI